MSPRRAGRRTGSPDTRSEILEAAKRVFADTGYDRATIRAIAAEADVDPSLIHHYFGTKDALFAASIDIQIPPTEHLRAVFAEGSGGIGRGLAETFFMVWEQEEARNSLLGILRSAMGGDDRAAEAFRQFLTTALLEQIAPLLPGDRPRLRALLMASHLVGIAMTRYVMRLEPIASAPVEEIIDLVSPRIESYVGDEA
jgi:AcrR family transcriptional regulator